MSESVEKVNNLLHAALLMRVEPGDRPPGAGYPLRLHRMDGEDWVDARDRIEAAKAHVVRVAEDILPADLMMTDRAFRVLFLAEEWAGVVVDERRFYEMSQTTMGAPTVEWEAAAMRRSDAEAALLAAVLGEAEG